MMTRNEFLELLRHELGGLVLEAYGFGRGGADGALFIRNASRKIDAKLSEAYEKFVASLATNGHAGTLGLKQMTKGA